VSSVSVALTVVVIDGLLGSLDTWCCRRMEISCTDRVRNEELHRVKEKRNILDSKKKEG
jgi:hypothetical protein